MRRCQGLPVILRTPEHGPCDSCCGHVAIDPAVAAAVAEAYRKEWAFVRAATIRVTRDLNMAEDCVQDAYAKALTAWYTQEIPSKPGAWLTTVARRRAFDLADRSDVARRALPLLVTDHVAAGSEWVEGEEVADDRLAATRRP
jgi:predicted RNA polymerase sigma factor